MISHVLLFFGPSVIDAFSITLKEFSRLHYCSFIKVLTTASRDSLVRLTHLFWFVNIFFYLFLSFFNFFVFILFRHLPTAFQKNRSVEDSTLLNFS